VWRERLDTLNKLLSSHGREDLTFETRSVKASPIPVVTMASLGP